MLEVSAISTYYAVLEVDYLENSSLTDHRNLFYQHDGALPHNGQLVTQ